jgi:hypothetical protein
VYVLETLLISPSPCVRGVLPPAPGGVPWRRQVGAQHAVSALMSDHLSIGLMEPASTTMVGAECSIISGSTLKPTHAKA